MAGHPHMLLERSGALASITSDLYHMLAHLRDAHYYNKAHALDLALPSEQSLIDLIGACAHKYREPDGKTTERNLP